MPKFIDMTGWNMWEHGVAGSRLTVISRTENYISPSGAKMIMWACRCLCGNSNIIKVTTHDLISGHTKSCGCLKSEVTAERSKQMFKQYNKYQLLDDYGIGYTSKGETFYFDIYTPF